MSELAVEEVQASSSPSMMPPAIPAVTASEGVTELSLDETPKWDIKKAVEDVVKSLNQLRLDMGTPTHPEESAIAEVVDCGGSQSSATLDSSDSLETSFHSSCWSELSSEESADASELTEASKDTEHEDHDQHPEDPTGHPTETGPLEYGEIPFKDLINSENYSNEYFEVKKSHLGGLGAFAKRDLRRGEVILVERPTIKANPWNFHGELSALAPELQAAVGRMHGHKRFYDQDPSMAIFMTNR